jgi:hypothetical protein
LPTLQSILEIEIDLLTSEQERGLRFAELLYAQLHTPTESRALRGALEHIIRKIVARGLVYPPVFILRKKQITRGEWSPREIVIKNSEPVKLPTPKSDAELITEAKAAYSPEQFERWLAIREAGKQARAAEPQRVEQPDARKKAVSG